MVKMWCLPPLPPQRQHPGGSQEVQPPEGTHAAGHHMGDPVAGEHSKRGFEPCFSLMLPVCSWGCLLL